MCQAPLTIWVGRGTEARQVETACHKCLQCRATIVRDWVGRNIAESRTAKGCHAITLTYGRDLVYGSVDHIKAAVLTYSDVQKWFKLLKYYGYPCRYFVTGEWGSEKGRAHWHVMAYWTKGVPEVELDKKCVVQNHWDEGFSFYTSPNYRQIWYNCKYILKGQGELEQRVLPRMSKKPPLGAVYFAGVAREYVRQGLAPQTLEYTFPEVRIGQGGQGDHFRFRLADRSAELFVQAFIDEWRAARGNVPRPPSQLVDEFEDWGRIINPDTFHYRTDSGLGNHSLKPDPRGPVSEEEVSAAKERYARRRQRDESPLYELVNGEDGKLRRETLTELLERNGWRWQEPVTSDQGRTVIPQASEARRPHLTRWDHVSR